MQQPIRSNAAHVTFSNGHAGKPVPWLSTRRAAGILDLSETALRARLRRAAVLNDEGTFADLGGGVTAIKIGRHWRVRIARVTS